MDGVPVLETVLDLLEYTCQRECELPVCEPMSNSLECTYMCMITICDNQKVGSDDTLSLLDEDSEDDEDDFVV